MKVLATQSCLTLCDLPSCCVHEILQARILEWVAMPFSRGSSRPREQTEVPRCRQILYHLSHQEAHKLLIREGRRCREEQSRDNRAALGPGSGSASSDTHRVSSSSSAELKPPNGGCQILDDTFFIPEVTE